MCLCPKTLHYAKFWAQNATKTSAGNIPESLSNLFLPDNCRLLQRLLNNAKSIVSGLLLLLDAANPNPTLPKLQFGLSGFMSSRPTGMVGRNGGWNAKREEINDTNSMQHHQWITWAPIPTTVMSCLMRSDLGQEPSIEVSMLGRLMKLFWNGYIWVCESPLVTFPPSKTAQSSKSFCYKWRAHHPTHPNPAHHVIPSLALWGAGTVHQAGQGLEECKSSGSFISAAAESRNRGEEKHFGTGDSSTQSARGETTRQTVASHISWTSYMVLVAPLAAVPLIGYETWPKAPLVRKTGGFWQGVSAWKNFIP